ncbi:hypothetical protein CHUAL_012116 [Chamberlinius hualienensis]
MPKVTFTLKDQTGTEMDIIRTCNNRFGDVLVFDQEMFFDIRGDFGAFDRKLYYKDGKICVKINIEPIEIARSFMSNNGMIFWKLDNFKNRIDLEKKGLIQFYDSPYFYTGPFKYRAMIRLKFVSRFGILAIPYILTGEFDDQLTAKYQYQLTITLINPDVSKNRTAHEYYGSTNMVTPLVIDNIKTMDEFVVDDVLMIKIEIAPMDLLYLEGRASKRYRKDILITI